MDILPPPSVSLSPPGSATPRLIYTALYAPDSPTFSRSWIACTTGQASTPAVLHRPSLRSLSCRLRPAPQVSLDPCSRAPRRAPFMPPLPPSVCPPFDDLNISNVPVDTCGRLLIGSAYPPPFPQTTPLPCRPRPSARYLPVLRRFVSQFPGLLSSSVIITPLPLLCCTVS